MVRMFRDFFQPLIWPVRFARFGRFSVAARSSTLVRLLGREMPTMSDGLAESGVEQFEAPLSRELSGHLIEQ